MSSNSRENLSANNVDNVSQKSIDNATHKKSYDDTMSQGSVDNLNQKPGDDNLSQGSANNLNKRSVDNLSDQKAVIENHGTKRARNLNEENDGEYSNDSRNLNEENDGEYSNDSSNQGPLRRSLSISSDSSDTPSPKEVRTDQTVKQDAPMLEERSQSIEQLGKEEGDTPIQTLGSPTVATNKGIPSTLPPQYRLGIPPASPLPPFQPSNNLFMGQMENGESSFGRPQLPNWQDACMQFGQPNDVAFQELLNSGQGSNTSRPSEAFTCQNTFGPEGTLTGSSWPTLRTELGLSANHALGVQENNQTDHAFGYVSSAQTVRSPFQMGMAFVANGMSMPPTSIPDDTIDGVEAPSQASFIPYSLYDPRYEAMGLPIDPILRAFVLKYGKNKINTTKDW